MYNEKIPIIIGLIQLLYSLPNCGTGGCCHVVTDDNNIYDDDLIFVIKYCIDPDNDNVDKELSKLICELLLQLSFEQRGIIFYMFEKGYLDNRPFDESLWNYFIDYESDKNIYQIIKYYQRR